MKITRTLLFVAAVCSIPAFLFAQSAGLIVISEVYGGGGNSGATLKNDFIELYNPTDSLVSLEGWSVQYASATGAFSTNNITNLQGTIPPKGYYLVQESQGAGGTQSLPTPDVIGTISMGGTAGKVALSKSTSQLPGVADPNVIDYVGYGATANAYEGSGPTLAPSNTLSVERKANASSTSASMGAGGADEFAGNGYDSNNNAADFITRTPQPQNSSSPSEPPSAGGDKNPPSVLSVKIVSATQIDVFFNEPVDSVSSSTSTNYTITGGVAVLQAARDTSSLSHVVLSVSTMADGLYTLTIQNVADTAGNVMLGVQQRSFVVGVLTIAEARAAAPGTTVRVRGIVTVANEFGSPSFLQDSTGGIGVYGTSFSAGAKQGDLWEVTGVLKNYYSLLELDPLTDTVRISSGNPLPAPKLLPSSQLSESVEGQLVRVNRVKFANVGAFGSGVDSSYVVGDAQGTFILRVDKDSNIPGSPIPADSANIVGIVNDFLGSYRLMPRSIADIGVVDPPPAQTWMDINVARALGVGAVVKVRGIVTFVQAGATTNTVFMQDRTGGLALYSAVSNSLLQGDSVEVKGTLTEFRGLMEMTVDSVTILGQGLTVPDAKVITIAQASEFYESQLVTVRTVRFVESGSFAGNTTNHVSDGGNQLDVRIPNLSPLVGQTIPAGMIDLTGVLGQFDARYQLIPRTTADFVPLPGPQITSTPSISGLNDNGFTISWTTALTGNTALYYGPTSVLTDSVVTDSAVTNHSVTVAGLTAGRVYYVLVSSRNESGVSTSTVFPVVTTSSASAGSIDVYFNYSVDTTLGLLPRANGNIPLAERLLERISAATKSIDLALYSFDDFSSLSTVVSDRVADSLIAAKNRGVAVRMVLRMGLSSAPLGKLTAAGVPMMRRNVQELGSGMHNKFIIIDGRDTTSATDDWVITGSWNVTNTGTINDGQNAVFIQDQSLARIYTMEFEEMFGSSADTPNAALARFGPTKQDNTPHLTLIHGQPVEVFFSPSDRTTSNIARVLATANQNIFFAQLSFTRSDLATTIVDRKNAGVIVRGLIDNTGDTGTQFTFLQSSGVDVRKANHSVVVGDFHHKYGVVDPFNDASDPAVITGSHNWSSSAENDNDENTIIIHSGPVARQYVQEFAKRYKESGSDSTIVGATDAASSLPASTALDRNYPNPFNPATTIRYRLASASRVSLRVYDVLGREIAALVDGDRAAGEYAAVWDAAGFSSGVYFCRLQAGANAQTITMLLTK